MAVSRAWRRRGAGVAGAVALLASVAVPGAASALPAATVPQWSGVPLGSSIAGGQVVAQGHAEAGDVVVIAADPPASVLKATKVGHSVTAKVISRSVVGSDGRWTARAPSNTALARIAGDQGAVNFTAYVYGPQSVSYSSFGHQLSGANVASVRQLVSQPASFRACDGVATVPAFKGTKYRELGNKWGVIGQTFSANPDLSASFGYSQGAYSHIESSVSVTAPYSGYSADGTVTQSGGFSSEAQSLYPSVTGRKSEYYKTTFDYAIYYWVTPSPCGGFTDHYQLDNEGWDLGSRNKSVSGPPWKAEMCVPEQPKQKINTQSGQSLTWTDGLSLGSPFGSYNLSIQTGYTQDAYTHYYFFPDSSRRYDRLCGVHNYPHLKGALIVTARG